MNPKIPTLWTIGHSNHTMSKFLDMLDQNQIQKIIDVRSTPYSSHANWFDETELPEVLRTNGVAYTHAGKDLGGRPTAPEQYGPDGRAQYDLMALTRNFRMGLTQVLASARIRRTALMCTEKDPLRCHRTLMVCHELTTQEDIKDNLNIVHILADGALITHEELMDKLITNHRHPPAPRWLQVNQAVRKQAQKFAYQSKQA